jgi:hypothetical protein
MAVKNPSKAINCTPFLDVFWQSNLSVTVVGLSTNIKPKYLAFNYTVQVIKPYIHVHTPRNKRRAKLKEQFARKLYVLCCAVTLYYTHECKKVESIE